MAVKSSGSLSITTDIVGEFGGQAPHSLSEYYRNGSLVPDSGANSAVPTSGEITFSDFYGTVSELGVTINSTQVDINLLDEIQAVHGTQSSANSYRVTIASGVSIRGSSSSPNNAAITWGDFPDGSTITLQNEGEVLGKAGQGGQGGSGATGHSTAPSGNAGGAGGDAIYANYSNQTMNVVNNGTIIAGSGGGGGGGGGGKGGDGVTTSTTNPYSPYLYNNDTSTGTPRSVWRVPRTYASSFMQYNSSAPIQAEPTAFSPTSVAIDSVVTVPSYPTAYQFHRGPFQATVNVPATPGTKFVAGSPAYTYDDYSIRVRYTSTTTSNYDGGNGGAGGVGGQGSGYATSGYGPGSGTSGSVGPGPAGDGGAGGAGGAGGTNGGAGSSGSNGSSGTAGNTPPGASSGGSGGAGGAAGRYIVKGSNTVTFTGSGTTAGGVA